VVADYTASYIILLFSKLYLSNFSFVIKPSDLMSYFVHPGTFSDLPSGKII
jgi:hypothetical protein